MRLLPAIFRAARGLANALIFFAALAAGFWAIRALVGEAPVPQVTAKLQHFHQHAGQYDTVFVGSSRIYHQVIPELFDRITAEHGVPTRSFNAGIDAMRGPEMVYFCDRLLRPRPTGLRWAFVEGSHMRIQVNPLLGRNIRAVHWHDPARMWLIFRLGRKNRASLELYRSHLELFFLNVSNLGRAEFAARYLNVYRPAPRELVDPLGPRQDGYVPYAVDQQEIPAAMRPAYDKALAAVMAKRGERTTGDETGQRTYDGMLRRFEDCGATTAVLIAPSTAGRQFTLRNLTPNRFLFDFADPPRYPALFEPHRRLDNEHVNTAGAEIFTRLLAEEFCAAVKQRQ